MADRTEVLLVEDNEYDVHRVEKALEGSETTEFHLDHVGTLADALDRIETTDPAIVLLDLGLPDSRGLDTLDAFRDAHPEISLVVLTGLRDEESALTAVKKGAHDYLVKDHLDTFRLVHAIRFALERHSFAKEAESALRGVVGGEGGSAASALIVGVANEIRASTTFLANVLTQIGQTLRSRSRTGTGSKEAHDTLGSVDEAMDGIHRIDHLLKVLIRFFGTRAGADAGVSLHEPVVAAVYLFQSVTPENVGVDAALEPTAPVPMESHRVQQLVGELLEIAAGVLPDGTVLEVATRDADGGPTLTLVAPDRSVDADELDLEPVRRLVEQAGGRFDWTASPELRIVVVFPVGRYR